MKVYDCSLNMRYILWYYISIYKVVISVCLSDHNSGTIGPICLKIWLGNSVEPRKCFLVWFWVGRLLSGKIAKIVIYDKGRVISGTNYDSPLGHAGFPSWYLIFLLQKHSDPWKLKIDNLKKIIQHWLSWKRPFYSI